MKRHETVADFRLRIAAMMRGADDQMIFGAAHAGKAVVRGPSDKGYNPPMNFKAARRGQKTETRNR